MMAGTAAKWATGQDTSGAPEADPDPDPDRCKSTGYAADWPGSSEKIGTMVWLTTLVH